MWYRKHCNNKTLMVNNSGSLGTGKVQEMLNIGSPYPRWINLVLVIWEQHKKRRQGLNLLMLGFQTVKVKAIMERPSSESFNRWRRKYLVLFFRELWFMCESIGGIRWAGGHFSVLGSIILWFISSFLWK